MKTFRGDEVTLKGEITGTEFFQRTRKSSYGQNIKLNSRTTTRQRLIRIGFKVGYSTFWD